VSPRLLKDLKQPLKVTQKDVEQGQKQTESALILNPLTHRYLP
jgi:hypothetical protein